MQPDAGSKYCELGDTILAHEWRDVSQFLCSHSYLVQFKEGEFEKALLKAVKKARPKLENT